ncbi:cyclin-dependent kinase inhibitor 7-like isoform X2 [Olea europaea var. sylvestris]|uniref:Cyclin-dependent kinase inhibitor n=1 Tax=Olea europaea subsp. europaea TaxID=158383 RepID=A0A8S0S229_OLEEU|nr:cyclin-dependent kinase inhibitor 7-like isoform X2 [Olea europaea var. sylvestris]CAA2986495.1 cyclin-dependent kinase inhibitor 7 isoform X2 [Olea europaea subsp. europaea]
MGEDLKKCKSERVMKGEAQAEFTNGSSGKRRKLQSDSDLFENHDVNFTENLVSPENSITSDCSKDHESNGFIKENLSSTDLKSVEFETEISISTNNVSRKTSPTKELYGDSEESEMRSEESEIEYSSQSEKTPPPPANTRRIISVAEEKMPSEAELEEFFEAEEKLQQKRFAEKYNYDIVKDVPMEGKYQWVRLKP